MAPINGVNRTFCSFKVANEAKVSVKKQALRLKWLSKDMNEHDQYMADFEAIFDDLERLGPEL